MTIQALERKIKTATELLSVVKTMKAMASVNIRTYERAVESLAEYGRTINLAWLVFFLRAGGFPLVEAKGPAVVLAIGSDQGMCGQFNEVILQEIERREPDLRKDGEDVSYWVSGERVLGGLVDSGRDVRMHFQLPGSLSAVDTEVMAIIEHMDRQRREQGILRFYLLNNRPAKGSVYEPRLRKLLPLDQEWAARFEQRTWPERSLPQINMAPKDFFGHLFSQYLFISLYRAFGQSLASENAARLSSMQSAEKNIDEMKDRLTMEYRQARQTQITGELMDVVSGFEALRDRDES
ncbi:F0F1 ATP synthase subunit gamma [Desulfocurvibacter africanus]|uniref:F0F1 ATP synthase subunit gamma n=1 Tax=Desulfocurvibacter africanus TaxID=873 RepID=UPI0003FA5C3D|nr:F0F1 ATP synthase subunit gamma [Desulfocurvibacter africanus]